MANAGWRLSVEEQEFLDYCKEQDTKYRFKVCVFPALFGDPRWFNSRFAAVLVCIGRSLGAAESRLIDNRTGEHLMVL